MRTPCTLPQDPPLLWLMKEVEPSPDRKIIKLIAFDTLFPPLAKTRSRMTTAIAFSRQNDTCLRGRAQKKVYNLQISIFISDHGKSWRIAGNITQRGSFEPDESQVVLQFLLIVARSI